MSARIGGVDASNGLQREHERFARAFAAYHDRCRYICSLRRPDYRPRLRRLYALPLTLLLSIAFMCVSCIGVRAGVRVINRLAYRVAQPAVVSIDVACVGQLLVAERDIETVTQQVLAGVCVVTQ